MPKKKIIENVILPIIYVIHHIVCLKYTKGKLQYFSIQQINIFQTIIIYACTIARDLFYGWEISYQIKNRRKINFL